MTPIEPRRWPLALSMLFVGALVGAAGFWYLNEDIGNNDVEPTTTVTTTTAQAEARDLQSFDEWVGVLQAGATAQVSASARGTVTGNAAQGQLLELGDVIAAIDGNPVVALYGSVPQFRELEVNSDDGADIEQLEANLVAMGFDPDGTVTVDQNYTINTGLMVERWEIELGLEEPDQIVAAGQIAFIAGPSEVTSRTAVGNQVNAGQTLLTTVTLAESYYEQLGDADGAPENASTIAIEDTAELEEEGRPTMRWEVAQSAIEVVVAVDEAETFPPGLGVDVELPDGQVVNAVVESVSNVARTIQDGQQSTTVVDVTLQPVDSLDSIFTSGPVVVRVETQTIEDATVIPVSSLIALAEGGHAVEIQDRGLVAVELASFDDGWVEITSGGIQPGDIVIVPA